MNLEQLKCLDMTSMPEKFVIFDLETTGLSPEDDRIIEMGAIKVEKKKLLETLDTMSWQCFVKQDKPLSRFIKQLTGINDEMLKDGETEEEALKGFFDFVEDYPLYAYNAKFDVGFVNATAERINSAKRIDSSICILNLMRDMYDFPSYKLSYIADQWAIKHDLAHRALGDCITTLWVFIGFSNQKSENDRFKAQFKRHLDALGSATSPQREQPQREQPRRQQSSEWELTLDEWMQVAYAASMTISFVVLCWWLATK